MARPLRVEFPGAFYHITSRGNEKKIIFNSDEDRERFFRYLKEACRRFAVRIHAYCLMGNHYHLLLETPQANLCRYMQMINSGYTTYFNFKHRRSGHLFAGRYKAILIEEDSYAQELSRYIHLNPVRARIVRTPEEYAWSSYNYYICSKKSPEFLTVKFVLRYFAHRENEARKKYRRFVETSLSSEMANPFKKVRAGLILGTDKFVQLIKDRYLDHEKNCKDLPSLRELRKNHLSPEAIINVLKGEEDLTERERVRMTAYFLRKHTGETLEEIGRRFPRELSAPTISKIVSKFDGKREKNGHLDEKFKAVEEKLSSGKV